MAVSLPQLYHSVHFIFLSTDTSNTSVVSTDVFLKVSRRKLHLLFEMMPGFKANKFVDEVVKATEGKDDLYNYENVVYN